MQQNSWERANQERGAKPHASIQSSFRQTQTYDGDIRLTKANVQRAGRTPTRRRPTNTARKRTARPGKTPPATSTPSVSTKKNKGLAALLTPQGITETLKSVGSLRSNVKTWLQYLQQADQVLDTIYVTSNSLRETGLLEKLVKNKGKNLTTDDFTNILMALMNTPVGGQLLKSFGGSDSDSKEAPPQE